MKNAIIEYIEYTNEEKEDLWKTATFVFDTNVFLNLYRYSNNTREQLIESFEFFKERIWMPYQVALEFCKDRYSVIAEANGRFDKIKEEANKLVEDWRKKLRLDENDQDIEELIDYLKVWIEKKKDINYSIFDVSNDEIFNRILELFDGKTGKAIDSEKKQMIEHEGEKRYEEKIPPGYKDSKKSDNKYGDLLVWKEILDYAKTEKVDIIFVTHDQKDDWWNISCGKNIGPRIELRKEFYEETQQRFHMYTMSTFLSFYMDTKGREIDKTIIEEIDLFASEMEQSNLSDESKEYRETFQRKKERDIDILQFQIFNMEMKNEQRKKQIELLQNKEMKTQLSVEEQKALLSNMRNFQKCKRRISQLNNILSNLMSTE